MSLRECRERILEAFIRTGYDKYSTGRLNTDCSFHLNILQEITGRTSCKKNGKKAFLLFLIHLRLQKVNENLEKLFGVTENSDIDLRYLEMTFDLLTSELRRGLIFRKFKDEILRTFENLSAERTLEKCKNIFKALPELILQNFYDTFEPSE